MKKNESIFNPVNLFMIALGAAIYAFGFVNFNMANHLAEGGLAGITLILYNLFHIDPSYSQVIINIPLFIMGYKYLGGKKALFYTVYGTLTMSFFIYLFQRVNFTINIDNDFLIAALLAGIFAGVGSGLIFRYGGTSGGGDIVAKIFEVKRGAQLGKTLLIIDSIVLLASLSYIDIRHMMYTLIASFVFSNVVGLVETGGYTVRGMLIISDKHDEITQKIVAEIDRGATYLNGEGAYSGDKKKIIYVVLNPQEVLAVKQLTAEIDPNAFISVINVHEIVGSGFTYEVKEKKSILKRK
ncbi:hypothetical protein BG261_06085 [Floricoccus tropicus]|uniref:DUF2179 domain-containing protein n=2 Tax=Floricoccus TaxID=1930830 RepID=A0A1E8GJP3_9LACT|nr:MULTISPECIES: YitT family protein [Floricoccus]OFI47976.1 hypothetical protein BG262_00265 [Floricoccus penangensis]OFI48471.1 hypothetical protein BG261_06085 [Floricoccus tropicus]URZ87505.1 YitT family protein [Floricoccus penangensis]